MARSIVRSALAGALLSTLLLPCALPAAATSFPSFTVEGRLATSEPHSCDGGVGGDLTTTALVSWRDCHIWKQHVDSSFRPIRTNVFEAGALRPLSMTIDVEVWCSYLGGTAGDIGPRVTARTQTTQNGKFRLRVPAGTCGVPTMAADGLVVRVTALMQYEMSDALGTAGTIRALWDRTHGDAVYRSVLPRQPSVYTDVNGDWVMPRFILLQQVLPITPPSTFAVGDQVFYAGAAPYYYDFLRGALGAWQTLVTLHRKLQAALAVDGHDALYRRIFVTSPYIACVACYTIGFENPDAGGKGGWGGFSLELPVTTMSHDEYAGMISVGLPSHEFGHSMHATIAPGSFNNGDDTMYVAMDAAGRISGFHIGSVGEGTMQQQEMLQAWVEGFGNAMGAYFLDGCRIPDRGWGNPDPLANLWNPSHYAYCDSYDAMCPYASFRFQMRRRGFSDGDAHWSARMASLQDLAQQASAAGAILVGSANELKVRAFVCDLLDSDPDVSYATGQVGGRTYVPDFFWHAAERLDGRTPPLAFATYAADPAPENVTLSLGTLLEAMDRFTPILSTYPPAYPQALWITGIVDGANAAYDDVRLSYRGPFSMQALGQDLVAHGLVSRADLNNVLRANRMEELP